MQHNLSQGVTLVVDHDRCDYHVIFPFREDSNVDPAVVDKELLEFNLVLVDEAEDPPELIPAGLRITCANIFGGDD